MAPSRYPFVQQDFNVPQQLDTGEYRLRMLSVNDVIQDYDAVMSSVEQLKGLWPESRWPDGLTIEQNLVDLGWHQREFQSRRSFAYTVVTPDDTRVLGCVYIEPTRKTGHDAEIYLWARECERGTGLDSQLLDVVKRWLAKEWPFSKPAFPGRDIDWTQWNSLPDEQR